MQINKTDRYFDGCIDNIVLNQEALNLWDPVEVQGNRSFCSRRYKSTCHKLFRVNVS